MNEELLGPGSRPAPAAPGSLGRVRATDPADSDIVVGAKPGRPADGADGFVRCAVACLHLARKRCEEALAAHDVSTRLEFPGSIYHLPIIYGVTGRPIRTLADVAWVLEEAEQIINSKSAAQLRISHSSAALDVGMAVLWLAEVIEVLKYLGVGPAPVDGIWLGAAADGIMRARGIEFIEESTPGFAAVIGEAPSVETAVALAHEMQQKSLYVFMAGEGGECLAAGNGFDRLPTIGAGGTTLAEQLIEGGVQLGWETRLVPFGRETFAHVYSIGFAVRVAMAFGGVEPGDCRTLFAYVEDRVPAFVVLLGPVTDLQCVVAAGAMNFGLPAIATHDIPTTLPSTDCTRWRVVPRVPPHDLVARSIEVRGLKTVVGEMDIPVAYGHVFSGERIRNDDLHLEMGSPKAPGCELLLIAEDVADGRVTVVGPEVEDLSFGSTIPLGVLVEVAGRRMQKDFEPILERQLHHLLNEVQGLRHMGQRDVLGMHLSRRAVEAGFRFEHLGRIIHSRMHAEYSQIVDRVQVTVFTQTEMVLTLLERAQAVYRERDERIGSLTDEDVDEFYSCTICQSFAPNHVCIMTPERCGLCGAYSWLDGKVSFQINPAGPSRPIRKDNVLDAVRGSWEGINSFVHDASHGAVERIDLYSLLEYPMTSCGCFECISGVLPLCNGIFTVDRDYSGMIPIGVKLSTLADMVRGGAQTPGFLAHSRLYVGSPRFLSGDGGILRLVWMPRYLKESLRAEIETAAATAGHPDLWEKIATEDDAVEEEEVMSFLARVGHPALDMEAMF